MTELHVIFGAGPLGKWTARELVRLGKTVRIINRSGAADRLPPGVEIVASDAYDAARNIALTQGAAAIYQCAQPHYYEWAEKFPPLQRAILAAAAQNDAKCILGDNLYMYGQFTGSLREDSPTRPHTKKGRVRAALAQEALEAHRAGRVRVAIGRASDFFGPDDTSLTGYAIQPAVTGKTINLLGSANQPHTFTYVADFGRLLATLGVRDDALGQVWFAPSNSPVTQLEFVRLLETELGKPVRYRVGGPLLMRFLGLFDKSINETVEMLYEWQNPFVVDTSKAEQAFGWQATPFPQALRETIAWCQSAAQ